MCTRHASAREAGMLAYFFISLYTALISSPSWKDISRRPCCTNSSTRAGALGTALSTQRASEIAASHVSKGVEMFLSCATVHKWCRPETFKEATSGLVSRKTRVFTRRSPLGISHWRKGPQRHARSLSNPELSRHRSHGSFCCVDG